MNGLYQETRELPDSDLPYRDWLARFFPHVCTAGFAARHEALWQWVESIREGERPKAYIAIWPRGGGKSTTLELIAARLCAKGERHFMLIVAGTQDQANQRVSAISALFETLGVERAVNQYGHSKGWTLNVLRTANGFNVLGVGLDAAARGVKFEEFRPDVIACDDLDGLLDTPETTQKKIDTLTKTILPTGSLDCAVLYVQNRILEFGVMSQLADGTSEFLLDREPISEEPALYDLQVVPEAQESGNNLYRITAGEATWEGQPVAACEHFINTFGLVAFEQECQHKVSGAGGFVFNVDMLRSIAPADVPDIVRYSLAWDFAGTEGGGDYTAGVLMGRDAGGRYHIFAVIRRQLGSERVNQAVTLACSYYWQRCKPITLRIPQDPAVAGKRAALADRHQFADWTPKILPVAGSKATRARGFADQVNLGNVYLVQQDLPEMFAPYVHSLSWRQWQMHYRSELKQFREDEKHDKDDQVDASSDGFDEIRMPTQVQYVPSPFASGNARTGKKTARDKMIERYR